MTLAEARDVARVLLASELAEDLTAWERGFLTTIAAMTTPLSPLQQDRLNDVMRKHNIQRGLTCAEEDLW